MIKLNSTKRIVLEGYEKASVQALATDAVRLQKYTKTPVFIRHGEKILQVVTEIKEVKE